VQIRERIVSKRKGSTAILLVCVAALAACTTRTTYPPNLMMIQNHRSSAIESLAWAPCGRTDVAPTVINGTTIAPYSKVAIALLPGCVDLYALDDQGRSAGEQLDLTMQPGTTWRIQ
jgi:hypothetical protein